MFHKSPNATTYVKVFPHSVMQGQIENCRLKREIRQENAYVGKGFSEMNKVEEDQLAN